MSLSCRRMPPPVHAEYDIGFEIGGEIDISKEPVHENIGIASFINSQLQFPSSTTYNNLSQQQWEYFRGMVWNDDPQCLLFDDSESNNHDFGLGLEWYYAFKDGPKNKMTQRSHFGDLQFLHSMASQNGDAPQTTKNNILAWVEVMYKLACGNQGVTMDDTLGTWLPNLFDSTTVPTDKETLKDLILATTPSYQSVNIQSRALGICLHTIEDSYAIGHTQRRLLNPEDLADRSSQGFIQFKPGTYGRWGPIVTFHNYVGQNDDRHSHYDGLEGGDLPVPTDLDSFNSIIGSRDAIDMCVAFTNFFVAKTKWEDGVQQFLDQQAFALDPQAQPANNDVDQSIATPFETVTLNEQRNLYDGKDYFEYRNEAARQFLSSKSFDEDEDDDIEPIAASACLNFSKLDRRRLIIRLSLLALFVFSLSLGIIMAVVLNVVVSEKATQIVMSAAS